MTDEEIESVRVALENGTPLQWCGRSLLAFSPNYDEEPVAFIDGGKSGDYIALWNVDITELSIVTPLSTAAELKTYVAGTLREARVQGMQEALEIVRVNTWIDAALTDIRRAIEAVRKGKR